MNKILILTAGFGEGEDVAAWNVHAALEHVGPKEAHVEVIDLLDSCYGRFHELVRHTFEAALRHMPRLWHGFYQLIGHSHLVEGQIDGLTRLRDSLRDKLLAMEPDVVVTTCPIYSFVIEEIFRDGRTRGFTLVALITEPVIRDSLWPRAVADFYAVPNETAARVLVAAGISEEKTRVLGFPVELRTESSTVALPDLAAGVSPRILYLINSSRRKAPKILDKLLEHPEWEITVGIGREPALEQTVRAKAATAPDRVQVVHPGRRLPQLLREHHVVISRGKAEVVQEAIAARCPLVVYKPSSGQEETNFAPLREANASVLAEKPRDVIDWLERAFRDDGRLLALWRRNLAPLGRPDSALELARFILQRCGEQDGATPRLRALPPPTVVPKETHRTWRQPRQQLLLCDLHTHTTWSDGKLSVTELVDFYGQRGFDCLCITDHLCDPKRLLGKLVNLTGLVISPSEIDAYFEDIEREKKRAWSKYDLLLMTGIEFNKDGYTPKTSTHLLGIDLKQPINPTLGLKELIAEIHAQGGLAVASHPHETKSEWGKDTLYLWEHVDEYAPLLDAWEIANRDDIFNPVGLKKLPFIASSDFHKPKHIHSWKTLLHCAKEADAIKQCIRLNRDVSISLYRDQRFGVDECGLRLAPVEGADQPVRLDEPIHAAK